MIADVEPRCKHEDLLYGRGLAWIQNKSEIAGASNVGPITSGLICDVKLNMSWSSTICSVNNTSATAAIN
jgi:hypothetical protein